MNALAIAALLVMGAAWALARAFRPYRTLYDTWPHGEPHTWKGDDDEQS